MLQCGVDVIEIPRIAAAIERWGRPILDRVWTPGEQQWCRGRVPELAVRFAAKEAISKTLGTGIRGIRWQEMEILSDRRGKPLVFLHGGAAARAEAIHLTRWAVSLTHGRDLAIAFVVASG
ncbi:MAG: holo-ACP synthase [Chloroflexota bacterium]|nr:holo-ACP synthase [Chloroflexota bacterium]